MRRGLPAHHQRSRNETTVVIRLRPTLRGLAYRHVGGTSLILMYHRVADLDRDPQCLAINPATFEAQMTLLSKRYPIIPLTELIAGVRNRKVPDRSIVVTFDDGYADNLVNATPILESLKVPATVFVSGDADSYRREFWWDELEGLILRPGVLPGRVELRTSARNVSLPLPSATVYSAADAARDRSWNVLLPDTSSRHALYRDLAAFLRQLSGEDRCVALSQLRELVQLEESSGGFPTSEVNRRMTPDEIATLDASPFMEVGGHTVSHPVLAMRSTQEQREEIEVNRDHLTALCGQAPRTFSYPYGSLDDYADETVTLVREAGYLGACSNHYGVVKMWTDPYRLPRCVIRGWNPGTLAERIEGWFHDVG